MAQVITHDRQSLPLVVNYPLWQIIAVSASLGILFFILSAWIMNNVVDQLLCSSRSTLSACLDSTGLSGNISSIIIAIAGIGLLVRLRVAQPLIVVLASLIVLWGLTQWTEGLGWFEALSWTVLLYVITYVLFSWITRYKHIPQILLATALIVGVIRLFTVQ